MELAVVSTQYMKTFLNLWFHLFEQVYVQPQVVISIHITEPLIVLITVTNAVSIYIDSFLSDSGFSDNHSPSNSRDQSDELELLY